MDISGFEELGMTQNESKAFAVLLEYGKLGAGGVSKYSGVSYSKIYDVLAALEQKGLVKVIPEKAKRFVPNDPSELMNIIKNREKALNEAKTKIKEMKDIYEKKGNHPVTIGYGTKAFYQTVKEMSKTRKYAYAVKWTSEYRPDWERNYKAGIKKGHDRKILARYDDETKGNVDKWLKTGRKDMRKFDNDGVAISIQDDEEVMISLIQSNTTMLIKDKPFAKIMKQFFLDSYKNAEKIK